MPSRRAPLLVAAVALSPLLALACENPNPGTPLGTFAVTSTLTADSCGGATVVASPGSFNVTLSNDHGVVYWFPDNGAPSASGGLDAARTVSVSESVADDVDQAADGSAGACTLQRNDVLSFTLASGAAPASFTGAYTFTVAPASGANCTDQLASRGGGYAALPCTATYRLTGTLQ